MILSLFWYQGLQPWYLTQKKFWYWYVSFDTCRFVTDMILFQNDTLIPLLFFLISVTKNGTCYRNTFFLLLFFVLIWYVLFFLWRSKRVISCHLLVARNGVIFFVGMEKHNNKCKDTTIFLDFQSFFERNKLGLEHVIKIWTKTQKMKKKLWFR